MTKKPLNRPVELPFECVTLRLSVNDILPVHTVTAPTKKSAKYAQIRSTLQEIGSVEPIVVSRDKRQAGKYLMVDGHLRLEAAKEIGLTEIECLIALDDEAFTPNKFVSRLATIQEHRMMMKAIERGVPKEAIAAAFHIDVKTLHTKAQMLNGICSEAINRLKDKHVPIQTFYTLKRMVPLRQIDVADLMVAMNNYSNGYATSLLAATPETQLVPSDRPKKVKGLTEEQMALMEREISQPRPRIQDAGAILWPGSSRFGAGDWIRH